ncbi:hypothetical protein ACRALDRAFT_1068521 [Sodiomyces alcalophilus JCM 7366]|uniref:uncharacterized protein n=1 Tax=Sodiomyces alcalophilus JCM 7366 TaxID=591952 RepID=UPI0039B39840
MCTMRGSLVSRWSEVSSSMIVHDLHISRPTRERGNAMNHRTTLRAMRGPTHLNAQAFSLLTLNGSPRPSIVQSIILPQLRRHQTSSSTSPRRSNSRNRNTSTHAPSLTINPPASTRPPHLVLPVRDPSASKISHWISIGKAYVSFYKTGVKAVFANRRLLRDTLASKPESDRRPPPSWYPARPPPASYTRADWVLLWRVRHDLVRVPLFALVLLICGEFTPLVVLALDGIVPYSCRLPRQIGASLSAAEARRRVSFTQLEIDYPRGVLAEDDGVGSARRAARVHVLRSLHLPGAMWDKLGFMPPGMWFIKGQLRMGFLEGDDSLLMKDGALSDLVHEELRIACAERGIDVLGRGDGALRELLGDWLRLTADEDPVAKRKRMTALLTTRVENWPTTRDFPLPTWHL